MLKTIARVTATVQSQAGLEQVETRILMPPEASSGRVLRQFRHNGRDCGPAGVQGCLRVVLFWPDDLQLVKGPAEGRRRLLTMLLSQLDRAHARWISQYQHLLDQRNALLRAIRDGRQNAGQLDYWTGGLARVGAQIMVDSGLEAIALPILKELLEQIEAHKLEEWEAGDAVARPMGLLYRCLDKLGGDADMKDNLYKQICRLDPVQALALPTASPSPSNDGSSGG